MGQKDYQQCMVVNRLLQLTGSKTELITFPTVREADGLAMSSRNLRLSAADREKATTIYKALQLIQAGKSRQEAVQLLTEQGFKIDYVELADRTTLAPREKTPAVALIAAFLGEVRLIDNMLV
jgi:pantoate--beta-alanine ligase